jgi:hypothetical protein
MYVQLEVQTCECPVVEGHVDGSFTYENPTATCIGCIILSSSILSSSDPPIETCRQSSLLIE